MPAGQAWLVVVPVAEMGSSRGFLENDARGGREALLEAEKWIT